MTALYVRGISVIAPGLAPWPACAPILAGRRNYQTGPLPPFDSALLPANERRRASPTVKLALQAAEGALADADFSGPLASVFASAGGNNDMIDKICKALTQPERPVSPTHFHNSVHNSPAGYWTIASQCQAPSLSLSANAGTCAAGLMEAMATALAENAPVLFIAYDHPAPAPLADVWPVVAPFALGLLLSPLPASKARCLISAILVAASGADHCLDPELERLRLGNPAARGLPLLAAIAGGAAQRVTLPYSDTLALRVDVEPCG